MPETPEIPDELPLADEAASAEAPSSAPEGDAAEIAATEGATETAEVHTNEKEETPVLDVHMPHATHTWKDFLIHIATISVGLLIAVQPGADRRVLPPSASAACAGGAAARGS
jgi:hypothetical protein